MDDSLVLAPDGAGGVEFRAESGGGGGGGSFLDLAGWTALEHRRKATSRIIRRDYVVEKTSATADTIFGVYKAAPSPPFTLTVHMVGELWTNNFNHGGLLLTESSPGKLFSWGPQYNGGSSQYLNWHKWTNLTTRASGADLTGTTGCAIAPVWLRMVVNASNDIDLLYSLDYLGYGWTSLTTGIDSGLTVANYGIATAAIINGSYNIGSVSTCRLSALAPGAGYARTR